MRYYSCRKESFVVEGWHSCCEGSINHCLCRGVKLTACLSEIRDQIVSKGSYIEGFAILVRFANLGNEA